MEVCEERHSLTHWDITALICDNLPHSDFETHTWVISHSILHQSLIKQLILILIPTSRLICKSLSQSVNNSINQLINFNTWLLWISITQVNNILTSAMTSWTGMATAFSVKPFWIRKHASWSTASITMINGKSDNLRISEPGPELSPTEGDNLRRPYNFSDVGVYEYVVLLFY